MYKIKSIETVIDKHKESHFGIVEGEKSECSSQGSK